MKGCLETGNNGLNLTDLSHRLARDTDFWVCHDPEVMGLNHLTVELEDKKFVLMASGKFQLWGFDESTRSEAEVFQEKVLSFINDAMKESQE